MCANAGRAPSGQRRVPGRCHFILNDTTKRRSGAVEFKVVRKLHRAIYNALKYDKKIVRFLLPPAGRRTGAEKSYDFFCEIDAARCL